MSALDRVLPLATDPTSGRASGMRWKTKGAKIAIVLSLRALTNTAGRWAQFWQKIDQFGAECFG
jgi:hypothetical protein